MWMDPKQNKRKAQEPIGAAGEDVGVSTAGAKFILAGQHVGRREKGNAVSEGILRVASHLGHQDVAVR